jgi:hypothetical protein
MKLYRLENNSQQYGQLEIDAERITESFGRMGFRSLRASESSVLERWPECRGAFYDMYSTEAELITDTPDLYLWNDVFLMLSARAFTVLEGTLSAFGEFLRFKCGEEDIVLFSPHSVIEADPLQSSELLEDGVPVGIKSLSFLPERVGTNPVFKTAFDSFSGLYCTKAFREKVEGNCLSGLIFHEDLARRWAV